MGISYILYLYYVMELDLSIILIKLLLLLICNLLLNKKILIFIVNLGFRI